MNVAVFGAGGFVGSHMVERLLDDGHGVVGIDRDDEKLETRRPGLQFHRVDVRDEPTLLDEVIEGVDVVVDLVAYANPSIYVEAPLDVFDVNFMTNLDIAQRCAKHGRRLIQYSSAEVYGTFTSTDGTAMEDETPLTYGPIHKHRWIYASAKQLLERVLHAHGLAGDLDYTVIRPFNFVGPRMDYLVPAGTFGGPRVVPHFVSALLTGGPMHLVDGGSARRTFLHIDDATDAFMVLLYAPDQARNQVFNVGNPANDVSIRELALLMCEIYEELTGSSESAHLVEISGEEFYGDGYEDGTRLPPDISKIQRLGWAPRHGLRRTLRDTVEHHLGQHGIASASA